MMLKRLCRSFQSPHAQIVKRPCVAHLSSESTPRGARLVPPAPTNGQRYARPSDRRPRPSPSFRASRVRDVRGVPVDKELESLLNPQSTVLLAEEPETARMPENPRVCTIALLGTPNAGKSMLINRLLDTKLSAVSPKRHTTRNEVLGVSTSGDSQLVLFDTPGIVGEKSVERFNQNLVKDAWTIALDVDVALVLLDAAKIMADSEWELLDKVAELREKHEVSMQKGGPLDGSYMRNSKDPVSLVLALNKLDLVFPKRKLEEMAEKLNERYSFDATFFVSALKDLGVRDLKDYLRERSMPREWIFKNPKTASNQTVFERIAEVVREKIFRRTNEEVPYLVSTETDSWQLLDNNAVAITQSIILQRDSHRRIFNQYMLQRMREQGSKDLSRLFGRPVLLSLRIRVRKEQ